MLNEIAVGSGALLALSAVLLAPELRARERARSSKSAAEKPMSNYLPYHRLVRPTIVKLENGGYLAAWHIAAEDIGTMGDTEILNTAYHVAGTLGSLQTGTIGQFYAKRVPLLEYDRAMGADHPVLALIDEQRENFFLKKEAVYTTQRTFVLTWNPPSKNMERVRAASSSGVDSKLRTEDELLADFNEICEKVDTAFSGVLHARRLGNIVQKDSSGQPCYHSELLRFLASCVSGEDSPYRTPDPRIELSGLLGTEVRGGFDIKAGNDEIGCIEFKSFPEEIVPQMLDRLTELKVPHLFCVRWIAQSVASTRRDLGDAVVDFQGAAKFNSGFVDPEAELASKEAIDAFGKASGDYTRVGKVSLVLIVRAPSREQVEKAQRAVIGALEDAGFRAFVRTLGALDTWISTLPGVGEYGTRTFPLNALTVAKLFPIHEASHGRRYAGSEALPLQTPALTYALGRGATLHRMHLNVADVFHGFGIGKTRSGKSVMLSYLSASFRGRLPYAGVTTIDRGRSSERMCHMLDGQSYDLLGKSSPGFALFADAGDVDRDRELLQILEEMVELQRGGRVTPEQREHLATAVRLMASIPPQHRSLYAFYELLQDDQGATLRPAIGAYTRTGALGSMLDESNDSFEVSRFNVIDIEHAIRLPEKYLIPILRVVVWKTLSSIRRMKERMGNKGKQLHWLINIDEAHSLLRHEIGARFIADLQKMGRKENIGVWLWSNSLSEFTENSTARNDLLMNSPTRIYFGDSGVTSSDQETIALYKSLQLPERGIAMLPNLPERSFILHQPDESSLTELNLRLDPALLAIVGTSRGNDDVERFRKQFPVEQYGKHAWKIELLRHEGAEAAAARLSELVSIDKDIDAVIQYHGNASSGRS
jgi:type IV secretory pathway VirB4 component